MAQDRIETEWELALKRHGIIKSDNKQKVEEPSYSSVFSTEKEIKPVDVYDDDEELELIRRRRLEEFKAYQSKARYGSVIEITAADYVREVNNAGKDVFVILHLYLDNVEKCKFINETMRDLASKYPMIKFIKSFATRCIKNFPENSVPAIFVYFNNNIIGQYVGPAYFGPAKASFSSKELYKLLMTNNIFPKDTLSDDEEEDTFCQKNTKIYTSYRY